jgi:endonuclease G
LAHVGAEDSDYRNSGYSRGHLAAARDFAWSERAIRSTFLLSNVAPQVQTMNAGAWARLEALVRQVAAQSDAVYVFSGTMFKDEASWIGAGQVAVPSHFFKVFLAIRGSVRTMLAAIVPNSASSGEPLSRFFTTVDDVEAQTGLDFFDALEDEEEERLESAPASASALISRGRAR